MAKKYTIKEFFESKEKLAIHTPTIEEALKLCNTFHKAGYTWKSGETYDEFNCWCAYQEKHTYDNTFTCCPTWYYKSIGYTILTLDDIIFEEPKEYNVKIEATESVNQTCGVDVLVNGVVVDWFRWTDKALTNEVIDVLNSILGLQLDVLQLQRYLSDNLWVEKNRMTIKQIEEKLGIENLEIIE